MLVISKPTQFGPDGLAVRGQCNHDSPGWQLRWFEQGQPLKVVWQGSFNTCRHLQSECSLATTLEEVGGRVSELLRSDGHVSLASLPTDIYPAAKDNDVVETALPPHETAPEPGGHHGGKRRRRKKRK